MLSGVFVIVASAGFSRNSLCAGMVLMALQVLVIIASGGFGHNGFCGGLLFSDTFGHTFSGRRLVFMVKVLLENKHMDKIQYVIKCKHHPML